MSFRAYDGSSLQCALWNQKLSAVQRTSYEFSWSTRTGPSAIPSPCSWQSRDSTPLTRPTCSLHEEALRSQRQTETPLGFSLRGAFSLRNTFAYSAASFSFFSGRTLRRTEAGFAANHLSSPVNGSFPKRFFLAGTSCATTFSKPGSVNSCAPFL